MTIRIACTAILKRIMAGHPAKDGHSFKGGGSDVTSDCLKAVIQFVGDNYDEGDRSNSVTVCDDGKPAYEITVRKL